MTDDLTEKPTNGPNTSPLFYDDISYKGLRMLCKQRGYPRRDARPPVIARLPAMGRVYRRRAYEDPEVESSAAKRRSLLALLHFVFVANKEVVGIHGP